jgi:hypothetical protein
MRVAKFFATDFYLSNVMGGSVNFYGSGQTVNPAQRYGNEISMFNNIGASVVFYGYGSVVVPTQTPSNFKINNLTLPIYIVGDAHFTWDDVLIVDSEEPITYKLEIFGELGTLIHTETDIIVGDYLYTKAQEQLDSGLNRYNGTLSIILTTYVGDEVYATLSHTFDRAGYGLHFGLYFGDGF